LNDRQPDGSRPASLARDLLDLFFSPREAVGRIATRPRVWAPILLFVAVQVAFTAVWLHHLDPGEFFRSLAEGSGRAAPPHAPPAGFVRGMLWGSAFVIGPAVVTFLAALFLFIFNFVLGAQVTFRQSVSVQFHAHLAVFLVTLPLVLLVMALKQDWNVHPGQALQANVTLLLEQEGTPKALYSLAESLDLGVFWLLGLMVIGYRAAARRPAFAAVVVPWVIWVLGKVAVAGILSALT
jgi:hypothetical protein